MACIGCGGGGTKPRSMEVSGIVNNTPMRKFIEDQGWQYQGNCGCRNNLNIYVTTKPEWSSYEIWMNLNATRLEVRRKFGRETKILGIGYTANYQDIYNHHLPKIS